MKKALPLVLLATAVAGIYYFVTRRPSALVLTGVVTTNDVVVSPQMSGQIGQLLVNEGDTVTKDQLVAVINPGEMTADVSYYAQSTEGLADQVTQAAAALRFQQQQTGDQINQALASQASAEAQQASATADLENARLSFERNRKMSEQGIVPIETFDQARTTYDSANAKLDSLKKQVEAAKAAVALARSNAEQIAMRRSQLQSNQHQVAAAAAQKTKADVRMSYTEIHAPIAGIVDVRPVRIGEIVTPGQPIVTLINPDDLWVRADVEETYVDRIRLGDKLTVRLPSGDEREGTVFYRGADAGFATQRDVSRTKRDIKTFEVRLRCDNKDRRLAVGMTAYVLLPVS
ncbi:MAG TPA: efflux RND transporter periplasmic adaptor subunit [Vicinamibacterales bacterium]|nr:efflux RND transporter periplasmic adaptor subunit [Vicinamibacterales bacterium]